ncbi:hypothetical protein DFJ73DRAFT_88162 [Zopfochytrium polystomum]|nr:hypothetical protein DFJ73DRAFT_88162 [Zopfochytrium polystomum]
MPMMVQTRPRGHYDYHHRHHLNRPPPAEAAAAVQPAPRCTLPTVKIFFALVVLLVATLFLAVDTPHQARVIALPVRAHNEAPPAPPALQRRGFFKKIANKAKNAANKAYDKAQAAQNKLGPAGKIAAMVAGQTPVGRAYYAGKALAKTGMAISRGIARHESAKDIFNSAKGEMMEGALNVVPGGRECGELGVKGRPNFPV